MSPNVFPICAASGKTVLQSGRRMVRTIVFARAVTVGLIAATGTAEPGAFATAQQVDGNLAPAGDRAGLEARPEHDIYARQIISLRTAEAPGTIIIDTRDRFLYLIQQNNAAIRYGIGVGRDGFRWSGEQRISRKEEWPDWRPPPEMIGRQPYLPRFMAGGNGNPMGARALYLGQTVFRIHGTNQPETIGHAVSSGCFRMVNDDVVDLYQRVQIGAKVIVKQDAALGDRRSAAAQLTAAQESL